MHTMHETLARRFPIGFGFCSHATKDNSTNECKLARYDVNGLALFPEWRIRGYAEALRAGFIKKLVLMGPPEEVRAYRSAVLELCDEPNRIEQLLTNNSTVCNAEAKSTYIQENGIRSDQYVLLSSDYHIGRAVASSIVKHDVDVKHAVGTETLLLYFARSKVAREQLRNEMIATIDPVELARRIHHEQCGVAQIYADPMGYVPQK